MLSFSISIQEKHIFKAANAYLYVFNEFIENGANIMNYYIRSIRAVHFDVSNTSRRMWKKINQKSIRISWFFSTSRRIPYEIIWAMNVRNENPN